MLQEFLIETPQAPAMEGTSKIRESLIKWLFSWVRLSFFLTVFIGCILLTIFSELSYSFIVVIVTLDHNPCHVPYTSEYA